MAPHTQVRLPTQEEAQYILSSLETVGEDFADKSGLVPPRWLLALTGVIATAKVLHNATLTSEEAHIVLIHCGMFPPPKNKKEMQEQHDLVAKAMEKIRALLPCYQAECQAQA